MRKILRSLLYASRGLREAYRRDLSFRMEIWASPLFIIFGYIFWPLKSFELLFLVLSFSLILITELINTSLERSLERLHPETHELIGISKDIASAAVFVAILFTIIVVVIIALSHREYL